MVQYTNISISRRSGREWVDLVVLSPSLSFDHVMRLFRARRRLAKKKGTSWADVDVAISNTCLGNVECAPGH